MEKSLFVGMGFLRIYVLLLVLLILLPHAVFSQTRIPFERFEVHVKDQITGRVRLERGEGVKGWIEVNPVKKTVVVSVEGAPELENFQFDYLDEDAVSGHFIAFSTSGYGFSFIPEEKVIIITHGDGGRIFFLSPSELQRFKR